ncbi:MAG: flagellar motor switch protein FliN [Pseudomonadota bacterium]
MTDETKNSDLDLDDFTSEQSEDDIDKLFEDESVQKNAQDLEAVFEIPVNISAVLGRTYMEVSDLLRLDSGDVVEIDRKVGEAIDIYVNNRLIARGEVVLVDDRLGVTMTEIIKSERGQ